MEPRQYLCGIEHRIKVIGSLVGPGFGAIGLSGVTLSCPDFRPPKRTYQLGLVTSAFDPKRKF